MHYLILLLLLPFLPLQGLEQYNGDLSLKAEPPPKPQVFGITFGDDLVTISERMGQHGLTLVNQHSPDSQGLSRVLTFTGTPHGVAVSGGKTELLFFEGKLVRMDFLFPPSYENFLILRNQLFYSMGKRFELAFKQEVMDDLLRSTIANMEKNESGRRIETLVNRSLVEGSTFFFYKLQDQRQELNVTYSYFSPEDRAGKPSPELRLHYSLAEELKKYQQHFKRKRKGPTRLLPSNSSME